MSRSRKKILFFIGLTYLLSWSLLAAYAVTGGKWQGNSGALMAAVYMVSPLIITIIVQWGLFKEGLIRPLDIRFRWNRWWTAAWLLPPLIALATFGIGLLLPTVRFAPDFSGMIQRMTQDMSPEQMERIRDQLQNLPVHPLFLPILQALFIGITINALFAFCEEIGWRGLLQNELANLGFWKSSFIVGGIWGIWHAPIIMMGHNYPDHRVLGVFFMIAWTLLLSPIFAWVRYRGKSVIVAAIIHGTINASPGLALLMIDGGNELLVGITGASGMIVLALLNGCIWIFERHILTTPTSTLMQPSHPGRSEE